MNTIIFIIISIIIFKLFFKFRKELLADNEELFNQKLEEKFSFFIDVLNEYCYKGLGKVTIIDNRTLSLYKNDSCQIVYLKYGAGILTIIWKFKYFQQEMVYQRNLSNARNINIEWQKNAVILVISEFLDQYEKHKSKVDASGILRTLLSEAGISMDNFQKARDFLK